MISVVMGKGITEGDCQIDLCHEQTVILAFFSTYKIMEQYSSVVFEAWLFKLE